MDNEASENGSDTDLGSGGAMVLPDLNDGSGNTWHLAVGAGKDGNLYVVNRDSMGKFNSNNSNIYQELTGALPGGVWAMPAYFNNTVYYGSVGSPIQAFTITNAKLSTSATAQTTQQLRLSREQRRASRRTARATESSGPSRTPAPPYCMPITPERSNELYNSNQASGGRDQFGAGNKFSSRR